MIKNYLLVSIRNLMKHKSYVIINTFGLGIAIACCITAYMLVAYNIEFDDFHKSEKVEDIFRVHAHVLLNGSDKKQAISAPILVGPMAAADFSGIKNYMRYAGNSFSGASVSYINPETNDIKSFGETVVFADSTLFDLFDFPLAAGSYDAFKDRESVFLDEERAKKLFGDEDPIGKVLTFGFSRGVQKQMIVGGVLKEIPVNSSIYLPIVLRFEHFEEMRAMDQPAWEDWSVPVTFFQLENPENATQVAKLFDKFIPLRNEGFKEQEVERYSLEPFKSSINQNDITWSYINTPINMEPLIIFTILALLILLIACFNLTNTSIAMTAGRLKEIGVRKSLGAHRRQVITQFMVETTTVIVLSVLAGYLMSNIIVPEFAAMWELPYGIEDLSSVNLIGTLTGLVVLTSLVAGLYPAFFSTRFGTVNLLKGNVKFSGSNFLTRSLVSVQFAISVLVLVGGIVFIQNTKYQEAIEFGYDKENLLLVNIQDPQDYRKLRARAESIPGIQGIGTTEHQIGFSSYNNPITYMDMEFEVMHIEFGEKYFELMEFNFVKGQAIDWEKTSENKEAVVVSKQFLKTVDLQGEPIGATIEIRGDKRRIVGVVDDFVDNIYRSKDPEPFVFYATVPERWRQMIVRADEDDLVAVNEHLEKEWQNLFPTKPYSSIYQEEALMGDMKQTNGNLQKIFLFLTILGGFLSAAGIFSLASLNIAKRTKEIGVRRTLGASVSNVVLLLSKEFFIIMSVAGILGSVGGYFGTAALLDLIYAYHMPMTLLPVIVSALVIAIIGLSTTSTTIFMAARQSPVKTLRDE
ncbi:MAG: ABC transporter permease [Cyclobacteriaceae bacterium]